MSFVATQMCAYAERGEWTGACTGALYICSRSTLLLHEALTSGKRLDKDLDRIS